MGWLDLEQPQPQFNPMGWLGGAGQSIEDPSVALARRMRQQSPNVPAAKYDMPIRDEYREGENAGVPSRGMFAAPGPKYDVPIQDEYQAGAAAAPGFPAGLPGRGVGSDYASSGGMGPAPMMPGRPGGAGSDYAASGGAGVPAVSPATVPTNGSGGGFLNDFGNGMRRVVPPWWLPENIPGGQGASPAAPMGGQPGGVGSDYAASQTVSGAPGPAMPGPVAAPQSAPVPMPQPKPAGFADAGAQLPPNATSAIGAPPAPQAPPQPSLLDRIGNGLNNNSELLLSLGAGFAGAPSLGAGMQRAFSNARPLMGRNQTVDALVKKGLSPEDAQMAASNPETLKHLLPQIFGAKTYQHITLKGPMGEEIPLSFDPATKRYFNANGSPYGESGGGGAPGAVQLLAPGVKYDPTLTGDAHLDQFSPEVKAAAKAYINGDVMPSGNPRMQSIGNYAKTLAQRWGAETGNPVSDSLYAQRRAYRTQLGGSSPSSVGGQSKAFNQGVHHMSELADQLVALDNKDPLGIPKLAEGVNWLRQASSSKQSAISDEASSIGQTLAGEVGKLFSGSAGGGVHERELTRSRFSTIKSNEQLAAALDATLKMMHGGLSALEGERDRQLGPNNDVKFVSKQTEENIAKIEGVIAQLRGQAPATAGGAHAPAPAAAPAPGKYNYDFKTGKFERVGP